MSKARSRHVRRGPQPYVVSFVLVLWWAWVWQSAGATARGTTLTEQFTRGTSPWWYAALVCMLLAAPLMAKAPESVTRFTHRVVDGAPGTVWGLAGGVAGALCATAAPALLFGVPLGFLVSELSLAERWEGYIALVTSLPALVVCAAACVAVVLARLVRRERLQVRADLRQPG